ncbi:hypothetical protein GLOIN_2v1765047 [Rhizophagus clarus]|uniref:Uncharacterized protein n=1 Tax=Rhizophagus clarus TaxID=94130 RepID=A0A8H3L3L9_9GLOM|nr:hypothetical protein GLOIN_2v1765047 [Rhizophagus clarus]
MAYIKCKIWPFSDNLLHQEERWEAMKTGHRHYTGPDNSDSEAELSKSDLTEHRKRVKKLEQTVDWIRNYVKEQTGLEPGKELKDSSSSKTSSDEKAYTIEKEPRESAQRGSVFTPFNKVIYVKKKSVNKKVKPKRNPTRACRNN